MLRPNLEKGSTISLSSKFILNNQSRSPLDLDRYELYDAIQTYSYLSAYLKKQC